MRVEFTDNYIFTPPENRRSSVAYKKGWSGTVRQVCGELAIAAGKAKKLPAARRKADAEDQ